MPRLNIEDDFWTDPRIEALDRILYKDIHKTRGIVLYLFKVAQKYWLDNKKLIPEKIFNLHFPTEMIDIGLVDFLEKKANTGKNSTRTGFYCKGSREKFDWYFKKVEAGRTGGLAKAAKGKHRYSTAIAKASTAIAPLKQKLPSSSCSSSCSSSSSNTLNTNTRQVEEIMKYFNTTCNKKFQLSDVRRDLIKKRLKDYSIEDIKKAIYNFSMDTWDGRGNHMDLVYAIGVRSKVDNLEKWLTAEDIDQPAFTGNCDD